MITLHLHDETYIGLAADYAHKDAIKALADYPDVRWDATTRRWLVHALLLAKVIDWFAADLAPSTVDFWLRYPIPTPAKQGRARRKTRQQAMADKAQSKDAIRRVGKTIVEYGRAQRDTHQRA